MSDEEDTIASIMEVLDEGTFNDDGYVPDNDGSVEDLDVTEKAESGDSGLPHYMESALASVLIDRFQKSRGIQLLGLDCVIEIRKGSDKTFVNCRYWCVVCEKSMIAFSLISHLTSNEHQLIYVEKLFPSLHKFIKNNSASKCVSKEHVKQIIQVVGETKLATVSDSDEDKAVEDYTNSIFPASKSKFYDAIQVKSGVLSTEVKPVEKSKRSLSVHEVVVERKRLKASNELDHVSSKDSTTGVISSNSREDGVDNSQHVNKDTIANDENKERIGEKQVLPNLTKELDRIADSSDNSKTTSDKGKKDQNEDRKIRITFTPEREKIQVRGCNGPILP